MRLLRLMTLAVALSGCGYHFGAGRARMPVGAERIFVRPLENRTTDAEVGALVAAALRQELARRGADGDAGAPARIEGTVVTSSFGPSNPNSTIYSLSLVVEARLMSGDKELAKKQVGRGEDYIGAVDPLESEGRRRVALRRAATSLARDLVEGFELP